MRRTGWAMVAAALVAGPGAAQGSRAADRALAPFLACRKTRDVAARAACYDAALDALQGQVASHQVVIVDHEQAAQDRRTMFGFGARGGEPPRTAKPARAPKSAAPKGAKPPSEDVAEINSTVVSAQPYGYDQWTIRIATGATWRTTEEGLTGAPKPGTPVRIRRGLMNGYFLKVGSSRAVRAMRVG